MASNVQLPAASSNNELAPTSSSVVNAKKLCLRYEGCTVDAVHQVDLELSSNERLALIGSSGSGKTTLLRMLEGSLSPTSGSLKINGPLALVYQDQRLVVERDVLTNVCSGAIGQVSTLAAVFGFPETIRKRVVFPEPELPIRAHQRVSSLSGGQRQRVAIARALCAAPAILLADEPMASLDPDNGMRVLELLGRLQEKYGFALIVTTHDLSYCRDFFSRFVAMDAGQLQEVETLPARKNSATTQVDSGPPHRSFRANCSNSRPRTWQLHPLQRKTSTRALRYLPCGCFSVGHRRRGPLPRLAHRTIHGISRIF